LLDKDTISGREREREIKDDWAIKAPVSFFWFGCY
jgi:hypothetical protein